MSSFNMALLEGGVDMEVAVDFKGMTALLDEEVPGYSCGEYGYSVRAGKGTIGSLWTFLIHAYHRDDQEQRLIPLGRMEIEHEESGWCNLCVPPRIEQEMPGADAADWDGKLFSSFVFQLLNSMQSRRYIELPGVLPTH